jgi:Chaperone of endosialidase
MKKLIIAIGLLAGLALAAPSYGQQTQVTGCIIDPNSIPYAGGQILITIAPSGGPAPTVNGQAIQGTFGPTPLDSGGCFSQALWPNASISPSGTQWNFNVTNPGAAPPVGFGPVSVPAGGGGVNITISGASQNVGSTLSAQAPRLFNDSSGAASGCATSTITAGELLYSNNPSGCSGIPNSIGNTPTDGFTLSDGGGNTIAAQPSGSTGVNVTWGASSTNCNVLGGTIRCTASGNGQQAAGFLLDDEIPSVSSEAQGIVATGEETDNSGGAGGYQTIGIDGSGSVAGSNLGTGLVSAFGVLAIAQDLSTGGTPSSLSITAVEAQRTCTTRDTFCYGIDIASPALAAGTVSGGLHIGNQHATNDGTGALVIDAQTGSTPAIKTGATGAVQFGSLASGGTECVQASSAGLLSVTGAGCASASPAFSAITSGTNTTAAMVLGSGSSLTVSGTGTNNATSLNNGNGTNPGSSVINIGFPGTNGTNTNMVDYIDQTNANIFRQVVNSTTFNSVIDDTFISGWNVNGGGGQISSSFGSIWFQLEGSYEANPGNQTLEFHLPVTGTNGTNTRIITSNFSAVTGLDNLFQFKLNTGIGIFCGQATGSPCTTIGTTLPYVSLGPTGISSGFGFLQAATNIEANTGGGGTSSAPIGLAALPSGSSHGTLFAAFAPPANCPGTGFTIDGENTNIRFLGDTSTGGDQYCQYNLTSAPVNLWLQNATAETGLNQYSGSGLAADTIFQTRSNGGIWIPNSAYTNQSNLSGFYAGNNGSGATEYLICDNIGTSPTPITACNIGGFVGTLTIYDGGTNMITGDGSGDPNLLNAVKFHGTAGVSAGNFTAVTSITTVAGGVTVLSGTSDERLKSGTDFTDGLGAILQIHPKLYRWNEKGVAQTGLRGDQDFIGFFAQDVQRAIPEAITATEPSKILGDATNYLDLDDRPIVAALVAAVKQQQAEIEQLKQQIEQQ